MWPVEGNETPTPNALQALDFNMGTSTKTLLTSGICLSPMLIVPEGGLAFLTSGFWEGTELICHSPLSSPTSSYLSFWHVAHGPSLSPPSSLQGKTCSLRGQVHSGRWGGGAWGDWPDPICILHLRHTSSTEKIILTTCLIFAFTSSLVPNLEKKMEVFMIITTQTSAMEIAHFTRSGWVGCALRVVATAFLFLCELSHPESPTDICSRGIIMSVFLPGLSLKFS